MSAMDPIGSYPESPSEETDAVYPCKGCGEILEEGKAFELAGNRWHIDCFRCNTCGTLLDSDANLLLLGDGSLICNNCTYSCNACGNKIEDLAILTGDQAFCAACFRCRNCKRKIENLRYARTSQGIFCMSCHESLMARRRKKARTSKHAGGGTSSTAPIVLDKSLPALPSSAVSQSAFSMDTPTEDVYEDAINNEPSPRAEQSSLRPDAFGASQRGLSPLLDDGAKDTLTLPASTYKKERSPTINAPEAEEGLLPMVFDPNAIPGLPPLSKRRLERKQDGERPALKENLPPNKDYFAGRNAGKSTHREAMREELSERSASRGRDDSPKDSSPHIAYQDKGRELSRKRDDPDNATPVISSAGASPAIIATGERAERPRPTHLNSTSSYSLGVGEHFKLQEAPKSRKVSTKRSPTLGLDPNGQDPNAEAMLPSSPTSMEEVNVGFNPFDDPKLRDTLKHPARGDSLAASAPPRKPVPGSQPGSQERIARGPSDTLVPTMASRHDRGGSTSSIPVSFVDAPAYPDKNGARTISRPLGSPFNQDMEVPIAPPRAATRPSAPSKSVANGDFIAPRAPPLPPAPIFDRGRNDSTGSLRSESEPHIGGSGRGHIPKGSLGGEFSMEEEMARILRGDDKKKQDDSGTSLMRRVSNAVKHGRSFSDRVAPMSQRTPILGHDISSPMSASTPFGSPSMRDDLASLRTQLRRAQQKIAQLESEKLGLEDRVNNSPDMKQVNTELREKRSTMAFLDTQREMVVRELETMTEHLARAKDSGRHLDLNTLKTEVLADFARSLQEFKNQQGSQIEDLVHQRNQLTDEIANLIQVKDKGLQEFESLSTKNVQLMELNAQLVHNIQDVYKANRVPNGTSTPLPLSNGLGIYNPSSRGSDVASIGSTSQQLDSTSSRGLLTEPNVAESATILNAPHVVDIHKGQQPKRFNWKRGGRDVAKNMTKGLKGAFAAQDRSGVAYESNGMPSGMPYSSMQAGPGAIMVNSLSEISGKDNRQGPESMKGPNGLAFFSGQKGGLRPGAGLAIRSPSSTNLAIALDPSVLFGSELSARCDYEKRVIPSIVTHCVEEVELRGMDVEGIYRKSGGSGQVKSIQSGFDRDSSFDVSDTDVDIHAVTSALKQYFRKLPNPLITYEVYDSLLNAGQAPDDEKVSAVRTAIAALPQSHYDTLEYLIYHLTRIIEKDQENLMTPLNISVVFAPTIMRPLSIEREMTDMQAQREAVRALLDHAAAVFD